MTRYGTPIAWAKRAGPARLRRRAAAEPRRGEKAPDKKLTEIAESEVNRKAA
jgi:ferritin-like metal-binding protein YciE